MLEIGCSYGVVGNVTEISRVLGLLQYLHIRSTYLMEQGLLGIASFNGLVVMDIECNLGRASQQ